MDRKQLTITALVILSLCTVIGVYAGTVGVNNLFGFTNGYGFTDLNSTNVNAGTEFYRNGVNYTQFILNIAGAANPFDQDLNTTDEVTFVNLTLTGDLINTFNVTQIIEYPQQPASYIIWEESGAYFAKNGNNGSIDFSGADPATITQNAIDALNAVSDGGDIIFKESMNNAEFTTGLTLYDRISVSGLGVHRAPTLLFNLSDATKTGIAIDLHSSPGTAFYTSISNLRLKNSGDTGIGIRVYNTSQVYLEKISCTSFNYSGLTLNGTFSNHIKDSSFTSNTFGVLMFGNYTGLNGVGDNTFENVYLKSNTQDGLFATEIGSRNTFYNTLFESNGDDGAEIATGGSTSFYSCNFEVNTDDGIVASFTGGGFYGCQFQGAAGGGDIALTTSSGNRYEIVGSKFNGNNVNLKIGPTSHNIAVRSNVGLGTATSTPVSIVSGATQIIFENNDGYNIDIAAAVTVNFDWNGDVFDIQAGENISQGNLVYIDSAGDVQRTDADSNTTVPCIGIAVEAITSGNIGPILMQGWIYNSGWTLDEGDEVFVSTTVGAISTSAPSGSGDQVQVVGIGLTEDLMYFNPDYTVMEIT